MKKIVGIVTCLLFACFLAGCGVKEQNKVAEKKEPLNLYGTWVQTNSNSDDSYQEAVIKKDGTMVINWIDETEDSKSLYWAGSFTAPTKNAIEYSWTSNNDKEQTDEALLASGDDTKKFIYKDGIISYEASALGTTMTMKLERK